jgi:hypothetical protein
MLVLLKQTSTQGIPTALNGLRLTTGEKAKKYHFKKLRNYDK